MAETRDPSLPQVKPGGGQWGRWSPRGQQGGRKLKWAGKGGGHPGVTEEDGP